MSNKYKYLAKNTVLFTISSFGSKLMMFFLIPLYTSTLSTSDYGTVDIIMMMATLFIYILIQGMVCAVLRFSIEDIEKSERVLKYGLIILFKRTVFLVIGTGFVWHLKLIAWKDYYYFFFVAVFFWHGLEEMLSNYLRATDRIDLMVTVSLISAGVKFVSSVITLTILKWGIAGYLFSMVSGSTIACVSTFVFILPLKKIKGSMEEENRLHREMRRYAIPSAINAVGGWIATSIDRYFLVWMKGTAVNGVYSIAYKIPSIVFVFCTIFSKAWGLSAIKEYDGTSGTDHSGFFKGMYGILSASLMLFCSLLIFVNIWIAKFLFAKDFFEAWKYSSVLIVGTVLSGLGLFFGGIFNAAKHTDELAITMAVSTAINIMLNAILIPAYSAMGAAVATMISYYVIWIMRYWLSRKYLKFEISMIRDHFVLCVLLIQIVMEHQESHLYFGQVTMVLVVGFLYRRELRCCAEYVMEFVKGRRKII